MLLYAFAYLLAWSDPDYRKFTSIKVGMSERKMVEVLGKPIRECGKELTMADCHVEGYPYKSRNISHKLYLYKGSEFVAYYYANEFGVIEDVYVIGS